MVKNKKEFFCECDATVVSTSSSSAKSANLVIPHLKFGYNNCVLQTEAVKVCGL